MDPDLPVDFSSFGKEEEGGGSAAFAGVALVVNTPQLELAPPCVDMEVDTPQPMLAPPTPSVDMVVNTPQLPELAPTTPQLPELAPTTPQLPELAPNTAQLPELAPTTPQLPELAPTTPQLPAPASPAPPSAVGVPAASEKPELPLEPTPSEPATRSSVDGDDEKEDEGPESGDDKSAAVGSVVQQKLLEIENDELSANTEKNCESVTSSDNIPDSASVSATEGDMAISSTPEHSVKEHTDGLTSPRTEATTTESTTNVAATEAKPADTEPTAMDQTSELSTAADKPAGDEPASTTTTAGSRLAQIIADIGPAQSPPERHAPPPPPPAPAADTAAQLPTAVIKLEQLPAPDDADPDYEPSAAVRLAAPPPPVLDAEVHCLVCNDPLEAAECVPLTQQLENAPVRIEEKLSAIITNDYRLYLHSEFVCDRCHHTLCEIHELEIQTKQLRDQVVGFFWDTVEVRRVRPQRKGRRKSKPSKLLLEANESALFMPEVELHEGTEPIIHKAPPKKLKLNRWGKPKVYEKLSNTEYQCIRCHKILPRMRAVVKHFDLVHGPKEEQCNYCQKYVRDKQRLINHKVKAHPEEWALEKAAAAEAEAAVAIKEEAPEVEEGAAAAAAAAGSSLDPDYVPTLEEAAGGSDSGSVGERAPLINDDDCEDVDCQPVEDDVAMNVEVERPRRRGRKRKYEIPNTSYGEELGTMYTEDLSGDAPRYICMLCPNTYSRNAKARDHFIAKHAQIKRFKCNMCEEAFLTYKQKRHHELSHTAELCPKCGKKYPGNKRGMLERHISQCGEVKKCRMCDAEFTNMQDFLKHRREAHEKTASCDVCGKIVSARNLASHRAIHSDERNYTCHLCGASFKAKGSLDTHLRTHSEDRPFSCDQCGKSFKHRNNWKDHERGHLNIRDFVCHFCSKSFKQAKNLKQHLRQHDANPEIFTCPHCPSTFKYKYNMLAHVKTLHTGELNRRVRRRVRTPSELSGVSMAGALGAAAGAAGSSGLHVHHHATHGSLTLDPLQLSPGSVTSDSNSGVHPATSAAAAPAPARILPQLNPLNQAAAGVVFMQSLQHHSIFSS